MQGRIPEQIIADIRHSADIVEVISDVVQLKPAGRELVGLCPFHSEKTPSFSVSPDKQMFYCFGCGTGGTVFTFLQKYEGLSYIEAVRSVAARYGITVPSAPLTPDQRRQISERETLFQIHRDAAEFFRNQISRTKAGEAARAYIGSRRISPEAEQKYQLGYAPPAWDALCAHFRHRGVSEGILLKAGLTVPRKTGGGVYDRFRDRIIFPITDVRGQVIGFGGRVMNDALPKYLNSPETPIFNKRKVLYGLRTAMRRARSGGTVFMVEGYLDVISLWQNGVENAVATLGTALGPDHVRILKGCARKVILVYDSDEAGIRAAARSIEIFRGENMDARILVLPRGEDPDSFIHRYGTEAFQEAAAKASSIMRFLMDQAIAGNGDSVEGKLRIIDEMREPVASVSDPLARSLYIRRLAERIGVEEGMIRDRMRIDRGQGLPPSSPPLAGIRRPPAPGRFGTEYSERRTPAVPVLSGRGNGAWRMEEKIVAMMLQYPPILQEIARRGVVDGFKNEMLMRLGRMILDAGNRRSEFRPSEFCDGIEDGPLRRLAVSLIMGDEEWSHEGCVLLLTQFEQGMKRGAPSLTNRIEAARRENNQLLLDKLLQEKQMQARENAVNKVKSAGGETRWRT